MCAHLCYSHKNLLSSRTLDITSRGVSHRMHLYQTRATNDTDSHHAHMQLEQHGPKIIIRRLQAPKLINSDQQGAPGPPARFPGLASATPDNRFNCDRDGDDDDVAAVDGGRT